MKIKVTAEDIQKGVQGLCDSCPVALAIQRYCECDPNISGIDVIVDTDQITVNGVECGMPALAAEFVRQYDDLHDDEAKLMEPFEFELTLP